MGPLEGIRVIDMGLGAVGTYVGELLGCLGADVLRIQEDASVDVQRQRFPRKSGMSPFFIFFNCCKRRHLFLDFRSQQGRDTILRLAERADVFIENRRPGVMERHGLGYEDLRRVNPLIIYGSASAFGHRGPLAHLGAMDPIMQAFSGFGSLNGPPGGTGELLRTYGQLDVATAITCCLGILVALSARQRCGMGQKVETSMLAAALACQSARIAEFWATGRSPQPAGSADPWIAPCQAFRALDGKYISLSLPREELWPRLCHALEAEGLADDARFSTNAGRMEHRQELASHLGRLIGDKPAWWWLTHLRRHGIPCAPFNLPSEVTTDPDIMENGLIVELATRWGRVKTGAPAWEFSKTPVQLTPPPEDDCARQDLLAGHLWPSHMGVEPNRQAQPVEGKPPLEGLRVIELAEQVAGPYCGMQLGDAGAEVIKVETLAGDRSRAVGPAGAGMSPLFQALNRNKKSIGLNLQTEQGKRVLLELVNDADVIVTSLTSRALEELRLDYASIARLSSSIVYTHVLPWGERGTIAEIEGTELELQAMSGLWSYLGDRGLPPLRLGMDLASTLTGLHACLGTLAALYHRRQGGGGQKVTTSGLRAMLSSAFWLMAHSEPDHYLGWLLTGPFDKPETGYPTADKPIGWTLFTGDPEKAKSRWREVCTRVGLNELLDDPYWSEHGPRLIGFGKEAQEMKPLFETGFVTRSSQELISIITEAGGIAAPFNDYPALFAEEQVAAIDMVQEMADPELGRLRLVGIPWKLSRTPGRLETPPPALGRDTATILSAIGYAAADIAVLRSRGIVA